MSHENRTYQYPIYNESENKIEKRYTDNFFIASTEKQATINLLMNKIDELDKTGEESIHLAYKSLEATALPLFPEDSVLDMTVSEAEDYADSVAETYNETKFLGMNEEELYSNGNRILFKNEFDLIQMENEARYDD